MPEKCIHFVIYINLETFNVTYSEQFTLKKKLSNLSLGLDAYASTHCDDETFRCPLIFSFLRYSWKFLTKTDINFELFIISIPVPSEQIPEHDAACKELFLCHSCSASICPDMWLHTVWEIPVPKNIIVLLWKTVVTEVWKRNRANKRKKHSDLNHPPESYFSSCTTQISVTGCSKVSIFIRINIMRLKSEFFSFFFIDVYCLPYKSISNVAFQLHFKVRKIDCNILWSWKTSHWESGSNSNYSKPQLRLVSPASRFNMAAPRIHSSKLWWKHLKFKSAYKVNATCSSYNSTVDNYKLCLFMECQLLKWCS